MALQIGVWIDHQKAVLAKLEDGSLETRTVVSELESRVRLAGGSRSKTPWGPQDVASDTRRDRKYQKHLTEYYRNVVRELAGADEVLIVGPGEAKGELRREIGRSAKLAKKVVAVEAADKMTDRQIAARVKRFFGSR
jgi:hypothetical protein